MSVLVITTGGTIGALPYADPRKPPRDVLIASDDRDFVREFLTERYPDIRYVNAGQRDSKSIDDAYRQNLWQIIMAAPEAGVMITHGTDTLLQTADFLLQQPDIAHKTVIVTGAMVPLSMGALSDGPLNLAFSLNYLKQHPLLGGMSVVLCDYVDPLARTGWSPRLYPHRLGQYKKFFDPADGRYNRIVRIAG